MRRYDLQKSPNMTPSPTISVTSHKPSYKLAIPTAFHAESLKIEITEPFDPQPEIRANELTFKRKLSTSSLKNPFSEDYLQSHNTEHVPLNASLMSPAAFEKALDSPSVMEIPSERHHDLIFTTYTNYKEYSKPVETLCEIVETPLTTEPDKSFTTMPSSPKKNLSYSTPENSDKFKAKQKKSSLTSHKKIPPIPVVRTSSVPKSKKKHYQRVLEEILQREKENRDVTAQSEEHDSESPMTPTLGARPFRFSATSQRKKSRGASSRKDKDDSICLRDEAKENLEKIKLNTEEAEKEKEYLKVYVAQLRVMIKKETEEIGRIEKSVKIMDHDMGKLYSKQKQVGKQGIDIKDHLQRTKEEVLRLLEEIDTSKKGTEVITEKITGEKEQVDLLKEKTNTLRRWLTDGIKERETQKGLGAHVKKNKQRVTVEHEILERERKSYIQTLEETLIESGENKKEKIERGI